MKPFPKPSPSTRSILRKLYWMFGLTVGGVIVIAALVVLFVTARLQQKVLNQAPSYDAQTLYSKAVDQTNSGDYSTAESYLQQALSEQADPTIDDTYDNQLAVVEYHLKKYPEAIAEYQKIINDGQDGAFAWNGIGNAYRDWAASEKGTAADAQNAQAVDAYQKSIALNPQYVAAYSNLALLLSSEGNLDQAITVLDQGFAATQQTQLQEIKNNLQKP